MSDKADPWYQPPTVYYRGEERFGTPEQMIDEITRLRERCERCEALEALVRRASTDSTTSLGGPGCFFCDRDDTDRFKNHAADCPVRKVVKEPDHAD